MMQPFYERRRTDDTTFDSRRVKIASLVKRAQFESILDIGCGRGTLLRGLNHALPGARLVGCDISSGSVEMVKSLGFEAHVADISTGLPFDDEVFDCVIYGEVIEHVVDPDWTLREIARVLRPNGTLIVTTPNIASWFNRILLLFGVQPIFTETSLHSNLGRHFSVLGQGKATQGHLKIFTLASLSEMLRANGFTIASVAGTTFPEHMPVHLIDKCFARFPTLASNLVIEARRGNALGTHYEVLDESTPTSVRIPITWKSKLQ